MMGALRTRRAAAALSVRPAKPVSGGAAHEPKPAAGPGIGDYYSRTGREVAAMVGVLLFSFLLAMFGAYVAYGDLTAVPDWPVLRVFRGLADTPKYSHESLRDEFSFLTVAAAFTLAVISGSVWRQRNAPWRTRILDQVDYLWSELQNVPSERHSSNDFKNAIASLEKAARIVRQNWYSHAGAWPQTWSALHQAQEAMLMITEDGVVRAQALEIRAALAAEPLEPFDPRRLEYDKAICRIRKNGMLARRLTFEDRVQLRSILHTINDRAEMAYEDLRSFHTLMLGVAAGLGLTLALATLMSTVDATLFPVCSTAADASPRCPAGVYSVAHFANYTGPPDQPWPLDIIYIEVLGAFGGWVFALRSLPRIQRFQVPTSIHGTQAWIKALLGATIAVIGVAAVQRGVLPDFAPQPGDKIFIFALLFGLAQEPVTRLIDNRLSSLLEVANAKSRPTSARANATGTPNVPQAPES